MGDFGNWDSYLDSFVIDERIYGDSRPFIVSGICLLSELCAPRRCRDCECCIRYHCCRCYGSELSAILISL